MGAHTDTAAAAAAAPLEPLQRKLVDWLEGYDGWRVAAFCGLYDGDGSSLVVQGELGHTVDNEPEVEGWYRIEITVGAATIGIDNQLVEVERDEDHLTIRGISKYGIDVELMTLAPPRGGKGE
jgi:hypothetical protein